MTQKDKSKNSKTDNRTKVNDAFESLRTIARLNESFLTTTFQSHNCTSPVLSSNSMNALNRASGTFSGIFIKPINSSNFFLSSESMSALNRGSSTFSSVFIKPVHATNPFLSTESMSALNRASSAFSSVFIKPIKATNSFLSSESMSVLNQASNTFYDVAKKQLNANTSFLSPSVNAFNSTASISFLHSSSLMALSSSSSTISKLFSMSSFSGVNTAYWGSATSQRSQKRNIVRRLNVARRSTIARIDSKNIQNKITEIVDDVVDSPDELIDDGITKAELRQIIDESLNDFKQQLILANSEYHENKSHTMTQSVNRHPFLQVILALLVWFSNAVGPDVAARLSCALWDSTIGHVMFELAEQERINVLASTDTQAFVTYYRTHRISNIERLPIRASKSLDSTAIIDLARGDIVKIINTDKVWASVAYPADGKIYKGWVLKKYLSKLDGWAGDLEQAYKTVPTLTESSFKSIRMPSVPK